MATRVVRLWKYEVGEVGGGSPKPRHSQVVLEGAFNLQNEFINVNENIFITFDCIERLTDARTGVDVPWLHLFNSLITLIILPIELCLIYKTNPLNPQSVCVAAQH